MDINFPLVCAPNSCVCVCWTRRGFVVATTYGNRNWKQKEKKWTKKIYRQNGVKLTINHSDFASSSASSSSSFPSFTFEDPTIYYEKIGKDEKLQFKRVYLVRIFQNRFDWILLPAIGIGFVLPSGLPSATITLRDGLRIEPFTDWTSSGDEKCCRFW